MSPVRVAIVYFSKTGTTARLAEALRDGAAETAEATLLPILGADIIEGRFRNEPLLAAIDAADAVAFGSPTYMGGPAAQFKAFADASSDRWEGQLWSSKVAAGFTAGACVNGDQGSTLAYFAILAAQHGMTWCNLDIPGLPGGADPAARNRLGAQLGVVAEGEPAPGDLATAAHLGRRLARLAARLRG